MKLDKYDGTTNINSPLPSLNYVPNTIDGRRKRGWLNYGAPCPTMRRKFCGIWTLKELPRARGLSHSHVPGTILNIKPIPTERKWSAGDASREKAWPPWSMTSEGWWSSPTLGLPRRWEIPLRVTRSWRHWMTQGWQSGSREREPESLEQAFRVAQRLESHSGAGAGYPSEQDNNEAMKRCRVIHEAVSGVSDDRLAGCLKELKQQQEHMQQLIWEPRAVVSTTQNASTKTKTGNGTRAQGENDLPSARSRRLRRSAVTCYGCGGQGYYRRHCPSKQDHRPVEIIPPGATAGTPCHIKSKSGLYLRMRVGKKNCLALLDTGSEITLVPRSLADGRQLEESDQRLQAANGTDIVVCGETTLSACIGRIVLPMKCLVVGNVTEVLIGLDWLCVNAETMKF